MILVALAGPPGAGKSRLAAALSRAWSAPVLDKDAERVRRFGAAGVTYTHEQDDLVVAGLLQRAGRLAREGRIERCLLDGRTFGRRAQVEAVLAAGRRDGFEVRFVRCSAPLEVLARRVEEDRARGTHPAADRDAARVRRWLAEAEPFDVPHLALDTHALALEEQVARVEAWLVSTRRT